MPAIKTAPVRAVSICMRADMCIQKMMLAGALALFPLASPAAVTQQDIEGSWVCDPYTMTGKNMTITVTEERKYGKAGGYYELESSLIKMDNGITLTTQSSASGFWSVSKDEIALQFSSGKFLSSSNSNYTLAEGQRAVDEQLKKKNWSKSRVLEYQKRLVTTPIKPMYEEAQVVVSCTRVPHRSS